MDMTMLDISGIETKEGDEVIVFGPANPVTGLAKLLGTIPYEILTSIPQELRGSICLINQEATQSH
jgi:alanine racemase